MRRSVTMKENFGTTVTCGGWVRWIHESQPPYALSRRLGTRLAARSNQDFGMLQVFKRAIVESCDLSRPRELNSDTISAVNDAFSRAVIASSSAAIVEAHVNPYSGKTSATRSWVSHIFFKKKVIHTQFA